MASARALRLIVFGLVVVATVKLLYSPRRESGQRRHSADMEMRDFWAKSDGHYKLVDKDKVVPSPGVKNSHPQESLPLEPLHEIVKENKQVIQVSVDTSQTPLYIVHLDLKGAAPKVKYLKQIFPLLSSLGAKGILLEYEDMFPYEGELEILRSPYAYSVEDIEEIKSQAKLNNLELIPLIQVFGHLEFVLKHEKFFHIREVASFPNSLNPLVPGSMELVRNMLRQVLKRHPEARWFHIGADEVHGLGESQDSKNWLHSNKGDIAKLFFSHVTSVARFMAETRPGIKILLWEDMLRKMSPDAIRESQLPNYAFPMIWNHLPNMNIDFIGQLISKYEKAGFKGVWFASAFKGASKIDQIWTPLDHHLQNHLSWLKIMALMPKYPSISFQGIALTGWQRYEHHTVLCELFPVAIPSLAICLQTLKYGSFNTEARNQVHQILGCNIVMEKNICEGNGAFAGSELYHMVYKIYKNLHDSTAKMLQHYHLRGSFSRYHRKYNFANPRNIAFFMEPLKKLLDEWEIFVQSLHKTMEDIYYPDTIEEWMDEFVNQDLALLQELMKDAQRIVKLNGQPKVLKIL
ncbi:hexosaminidase D [Chanos chanos]|uniref:beta-N-acetylhexosaminidase n=1 Tax=Chanos chanos TaxID=29144 RepID=A0A6J2WPP8_CHACN|nr:hexosaminidase D-like [Chanos chanos]